MDKIDLISLLVFIRKNKIDIPLNIYTYNVDRLIELLKTLNIKHHFVSALKAKDKDKYSTDYDTVYSYIIALYYVYHPITIIHELLSICLTLGEEIKHIHNIFTVPYIINFSRGHRKDSNEYYHDDYPMSPPLSDLIDMDDYLISSSSSDSIGRILSTERFINVDQLSSDTNGNCYKLYLNTDNTYETPIKSISLEYRNGVLYSNYIVIKEISIELHNRIIDESVIDESVIDKSVIDESVIDKSVIDKSVIDKSVIDKEKAFTLLCELLCEIKLSVPTETSDWTIYKRYNAINKIDMFKQMSWEELYEFFDQNINDDSYHVVRDKLAKQYNLYDEYYKMLEKDHKDYQLKLSKMFVPYIKEDLTSDIVKEIITTYDDELIEMIFNVKHFTIEKFINMINFKGNIKRTKTYLKDCSKSFDNNWDGVRYGLHSFDYKYKDFLLYIT